jgi:hypothetical protein
MDMTARIVSLREGDPPEEVGRVIWDGMDVTIEGSDVLKADLEQGVQDGPDDVFPSDGPPFLDAVLQAFGGGYLWAEEVVTQDLAGREGGKHASRVNVDQIATDYDVKHANDPTTNRWVYSHVVDGETVEGPDPVDRQAHIAEVVTAIKVLEQGVATAKTGNWRGGFDHVTTYDEKFASKMQRYLKVDSPTYDVLYETREELFRVARAAREKEQT